MHPGDIGNVGLRSSLPQDRAASQRGRTARRLCSGGSVVSALVARDPIVAITYGQMSMFLVFLRLKAPSLPKEVMNDWPRGVPAVVPTRFIWGRT